MHQQNLPLRFALANGQRHTALLARLADLRLTAAFLELTKALPRGRASFPQRHVFDNVARADCPTMPKGIDLRDFLLLLARTAADTNDAAVVSGTKVVGTRYLAEIQAQFLAALPAGETQSLDAATIVAAKEASEALASITKAGVTRCPTDIEAAHRETDEAIQSLHEFKASALSQLQPRYSGHAS